MKTILIYLAGVVTLPVLAAVFFFWLEFSDERARRRYQRAQTKFSEEFDALSERELLEFQARWTEHDYYYGHLENDRARYFVMRWDDGRTNEI